MATLKFTSVQESGAFLKLVEVASLVTQPDSGVCLFDQSLHVVTASEPLVVVPHEESLWMTILIVLFDMK